MLSKLLMGLERGYRANVSRVIDVEKGNDGHRSLKSETSGISFTNLTDKGNDDKSKRIEWKKILFDFTGSNDDVKKVDSEKFRESGYSFINLTDKDSKDESNKTDWEKFLFDFAGSDGSNDENEDIKKVDCEKLEKSGFSFVNLTDKDKKDEKKLLIDYADSEGSNDGTEDIKKVKEETRSLDGISSDGSDDIIKSSENVIACSKGLTKDDGDGMMNTVSTLSSQKRKRDCFSGMLGWMANVAKDPTDLVRWSLYGNDNSWKQALLAREALFLKDTSVCSADQIGCQKKQKVRPSFDHSENSSYRVSYTPRPRQRLEARLDMQPTASIYTSRPQQRIPVAKAFQAVVPDWTGVPVKSDPKWLGTRTWPLENTVNKLSTEKHPLVNGRTDTCGCQFPGSTDCIKLHVSERRRNMRFDLGCAFHAWDFNKMGEDCSVSWTIEEEKIFKQVVMENPKSSLKCFWEQMCKALPQKRWSDQVNYYYNVFILQRRGYQNRHYPSDIDSDDDETEYGLTRNSVGYETA